MSNSKLHARIGLLTASLFTLILAGCGGRGIPAPQTLRSAAKIYIGNTYGLHIQYPVLDWPAQPVGYWRLWDTNVNWANVEPVPGVFNFGLLDLYVDLAARHGTQIIYVLGNTPTWAAQDPTQTGSELTPGGISPPAHIEDWQNFVATIAARYRNRIQAYEVWNEANLPQYWAGSMDQMLQLSKVAYTTIKQVDPDALVLAPSVVEHGGLSWANNYLSNGGAAYTDVVPFHLYDADPPEQAVGFYQQVLALGQSFNKPVWDTEVGYGPWGGLTDGQAASWVARTLILQTAVGIPHIVWYAWDNRGPWVHLFLVGSDFYTPTPAGVAFGEVVRWLRNSSITCSSQLDGSWQCPLATPTGRQTFIVWNPVAATTLNVPPSWKVEHVRDLAGNVNPIAQDQVPLSASPVLLQP